MSDLNQTSEIKDSTNQTLISEIKRLRENRGGKRSGAGRKRKSAADTAAAPSRSARMTLDDFCEAVSRERSTFLDRLVSGRTVARNLDGSEFSWPDAHPLSVMRKYVNDVLIAGAPLACDLVKHATKRFLLDLRDGAERDVFIDPVAVENIATWFKEFGEFPLQPWELFIVGQLMGWKRVNGTRRFREAWFEVAKKSGKTALMGGLALFLIVADGEPYAEVYSLANKRDQAKLCFKAAERMVDSNDELFTNIKAFQSSLVFRGATYQFLSSESKSADGPNTHALFFDEVHEFDSDELYTKMTQGRVTRSQPLVVSSTTAGSRPESFAGQRHEFFSNLLRGIFDDDAKFAFIASLDEGDDWKDEINWIKSSPNLGVTVRIENLREMINEIENYPANLTGFLRYVCNLWLTPMEGHSLPPDRVLACAGPHPEMTPRERREWFISKYGNERCFGGFDYGESSDMCCFTLLFPNIVFDGDDAPKLVALPFYWIPEAEIPRKEKSWRVPLQQWVRDGWIQTLSGNLADPALIRPQLEDLYNNRFRVADTGFDRWGGIKTMMASFIDEHIAKTTEVPQNATYLTTPSKEFKLAVLNGTFVHLGNPVLEWNLLNVSLEQDERTQSMIPRKANGDKNRKIDGVQATITALQRALDKDNAEFTYGAITMV